MTFSFSTSFLPILTSDRRNFVTNSLNKLLFYFLESLLHGPGKQRSSVFKYFCQGHTAKLYTIVEYVCITELVSDLLFDHFFESTLA